MTKDQKVQLVEELSQKLAATDYFYIVNGATLTVDEVNKFRKACFAKGIEYQVVKNTLIAKALDKLESDTDYAELKSGALKGMSGILFSPESGSEPAKVLKAFQKDMPKDRKIPALKGACIDGGIYVGEEHLEALTAVKSKAELIGDVLGLLQSPAKSVVSALQSSGQTISGLLKTLEEKGE
ncbi:50S ribosomal protein L10 [Flammeovirga kamogawensis]|uniref:Large ribosomal subunit protein uL10 n=1 Tax=Flammeovirga kamogawensis TaxID=373891 RepID=A0ABX8GSW4_9BACT|nr:50S ribosomal protein L10 [Flammeovirga kamogawensis]MBB6463984.1 large subunit ribosomal protein L10 [Flammeovirga kamogawensis]QWG06611.1 50S ribosomal protein L10 [Flammeovirga kamogawensis]TRX68435.1 50S ribosomal protein L10 [Flammeovirga kamogawensis]